jgi:hypothetical protein
MTGGPRRDTERAFAERLLAQRQRREEVLGLELASEPAWTMLVALFIAHEEGKPASVTEVCAAAGTPPATALRWLATVAAEGKVTWGTATTSPDGDTITLAPDMADRLRNLFRVWIQEGR